MCVCVCVCVWGGGLREKTLFIVSMNLSCGCVTINIYSTNSTLAGFMPI